MRPAPRLPAATILVLSFAPAPAAHAAGAYDGAQLTLLWAAPFAGLLLSIALIPLFAQKFWHRHYGKSRPRGPSPCSCR